MVNLLCEHSELFSETWPTSGMMLDGKVFALPMQAHLTTDSESLSLPTPSAAQEPGFTVEPVDKDGNPTSNPNERWYHPETGRLMQKGITQALNAVLPTPTTMDAKATNDYDTAQKFLREGRQNCLTYEMMPTPVASEGTKAPSQQTSEVKSKTGQVWLSNVAKDVEISWGKFEPAIRRWESIIGRPAPAPTKPDGKDGAHRLSSEFTEWMMGVPAGWITGVGLSRNDELKACGNGVVPQQAELALRMLLEGVETTAGGGLTMLPTPTVSDTFTDNLKSTQQKEGSMHSVTLPQAVKGIDLKATTPARTQAGAV
jgi:hypothetical protein